MRTSAAMAKLASLLVMFLPRLVAESNTEERTGFLRVGEIPDVTKRDEANQRVLLTTSGDLFMPSPSPISTSTDSVEESTCSNGVPGIQTGNVCCAMECGRCGGSGCRGLPGGSESCCTGRISSTGSPCSEVDEAPCFITEDEPTPSPTMMPTMEMSTCSNGSPGIQRGDVCCAMECGMCGGSGCGRAPGGADSCCTSRILSTGSPCSDVGEAPCFITDDEPTPSPTVAPTMSTVDPTFMMPTMEPTVPPTTAMPTMMPTMETSTCSNGFPGIQTDNVCCAVECGQCGGRGCGSAPGGADSCCTSRILNSGGVCAEVGEAPCFIAEDPPTPSPTMMPNMMPTIMPSLEETTCLNGFAGIQNGNVCCPLACGQCGGVGCSSAPGGADSCCTSRILNTGSSCSAVSEAPCFIGADGPTPSPTMMPTITFMPTTLMPTMMPSLEETTCLNGFAGIQNGNVCCPLSCGQCGGVGCSSAPGGADSCCTSRILNTGSSCSTVSEAPCFIGADGPTPSPTLMPTITFMPTTMRPTMMPTMEMSTCSNGFLGIQSGNVCCDAECGLCGGVGCSSAPGGADSCCTARIVSIGSPCSEAGEAPCFIS